MVILLTKDTFLCKLAAGLAKSAFGDVTHVSGNWGDPLPDIPQGIPILSFLSPWIVPEHALRAAPLALNWHPGTKDYPGIGCYNFALYEGAEEYGAVCHIMWPKVDTGPIVDERRFRISPTETVESLKLRTLVVMLHMFGEAVHSISEGAIPEPRLEWSRRPFTRKELNALGEITPQMCGDEIQRRIRAMAYPGFPGAKVTISGAVFYHPPPAAEPLI